MTADSPTIGRRALLRAGAAAAAGAAATATAAGQDGPDYGGWFDDVSNYDGTTVDETGSSEVRIEVGASGNQGNFAFSPPAVRVDPGTTVVWEWTGQGGAHNVVEAEESGGHYASELLEESGATYSLTFESEGISKYFCDPHRSLGMKGAVVVGSGEGDTTVSDAGSGGGGGGNESGGSGNESSGEGSEGGEDASGDERPDLPSNIELYGVAAIIAVLSPIAFAIHLALNYRNE